MLKQSKELEAASFSLIASLPPTPDIQVPMSAFHQISSASPPRADFRGTATRCWPASAIERSYLFMLAKGTDEDAAPQQEDVDPESVVRH